MANAPIDITILGKILLSEFEELDSAKFKLAVIYSMMNGRSCRIYSLNGRVLRLFRNKKRHLALFKLKIDEAINSLIATRVLIRHGYAYGSLKLTGDYLDTYNTLKMNIEREVKMEQAPEKSINLVDSFTKEKSDYLPGDTVSNPDEIIWFLKTILINIRQRAGNGCKDCGYAGALVELCFKHIEPASLLSHVDIDDETFLKLSLRLKSLYHEAADKAMRKGGRG